MPGHRKKPFSSKQKKEQLKAKREKKRETERDEFGKPIRHRGRRHKHGLDDGDDSDYSQDSSGVSVQKVSSQPHKNEKGYDPNRYKLHFLRQSDDDIRKHKAEARVPLEDLPEAALEIGLEDVYKPGSVLDMPKRPPWDYNMSKQKLVAKEEAYFKGYLDRILEEHSLDSLSFFEVNLETWRQLWRVVEMADVILLITDIRHPALHFSPALYDYVTKDLHKQMILVLNKIDLASPELVVAWKHYFQDQFPNLHIVSFTSFPRETREQRDPGKVLHKRRRRNVSHAAGPRELHRILENIVQDKVNLSSWHEKVEQEIAGVEPRTETEVHAEEYSGDFHTHEAYKDGVLTIGCCGYPNVGKSSLINGLMGRKVVSVSKTPGHTKHFQTIFLTPTVKLCDSPGLVFPSLVVKPMQILAGIYPIAQVREPYTAVGYLSQRIPVHRLLALTHPSVELKPHERSTEQHRWSAMDICEAWADKRGFLTAKAARPDFYRAANHILRLALEGRLCMCTRPPGFTKQKEFWQNHPETNKMGILQEHAKPETEANDSDLEMTSDSDIEHEKETASGSDMESEDSGGGETGYRNPFAVLGGDD